MTLHIRVHGDRPADLLTCVAASDGSAVLLDPFGSATSLRRALASLLYDPGHLAGAVFCGPCPDNADLGALRELIHHGVPLRMTRDTWASLRPQLDTVHTTRLGELTQLVQPDRPFHLLGLRLVPLAAPSISGSDLSLLIHHQGSTVGYVACASDLMPTLHDAALVVLRDAPTASDDDEQGLLRVPAPRTLVRARAGNVVWAVDGRDVHAFEIQNAPRPASPPPRLRMKPARSISIFTREPPLTSNSARSCSHCGEPGHYRGTCPRR